MSVNGMSSGDSAYNLIKEGIKVSSVRSKVISNNIANINTAGYKAYSVSFEDTLKDSTDQLQMSVTKDNHIQAGNVNGSYKVLEDTTTSARQDGNNVDIDKQMVDLASNQLMYNALISQVNSKLSLERYVVSGGKWSNIWMLLVQ